MEYKIQDINTIISGRFANPRIYDGLIRNIVFDTRKITFAKNAIFVALKGAVNDGHNYLKEAYSKGIRNFIVSLKPEIHEFPHANFILVDSTLQAIQELATYHRRNFSGIVIAVTGSNGKTIIKEWLAECLSYHYNTFKSPLSYNSQIGVPLSILQIENDHDFAVIEAGISMPGEMKNHRLIIQPKFGILSNIGDAHDSGFTSKKEKLQEKLLLFDSCDHIIYCKDHQIVDQAIHTSGTSNAISWGVAEDSDIRILKHVHEGSTTQLNLSYNNLNFDFKIPFVNKFLSENCLHIIAFLLSQKWTQSQIQPCIQRLKSLPNRLEIKEGKNNNLLINDSYSLDMASLQLALEYQDQYSKSLQKTLFISAFEQQQDELKSISNLLNLIDQKSIHKVVAIGFRKEHFNGLSTERISFYNTTEDCLRNFDFESLQNSCILIKGARSFAFEKLFNHMSQQVHQTVLETDLNAVSRNIKTYKSLLKPSTLVMAVVKAEAYGSGSQQMAKFFETQNINYLAVALIDEAIRIRESNCQLPIMVFNIQDDNLKHMWDYELEPEIYSLAVLQRIHNYAEQLQKSLKIHLKIDSGMHRLGIMPYQIDRMLELIHNSRFLKVASVFSHLSASEDPSHDKYSTTQLKNFDASYDKIARVLGYSPLKHILNTAGIVRFPEYQYDMVRIGLGLYGIDETNSIQDQLEFALSLKAKILQIKPLAKDQTTGYSRAGKVITDTQIAIISIGYADGFMRSSGNGNFQVTIKSKKFPTIGNICMDVSMVDLGENHHIHEAEDVVIFNEIEQLRSLAESANTISYEIISRIAPRVKRIYIYN